VAPLDSTYSYLRGGNYQFVYPNISNIEVNEGLQRVIGLSEKQIYFVPEDWLQCCPRITNISEMFLGVGSPRKFDSENPKKIQKAFDYGSDNANAWIKLNLLKVPNNLF
jgi:hypothetical protein